MGKFVSEDSENSKNVSSINEILYKNANSNSKKESYVDKEKRDKRLSILSICFYVFVLICSFIALKEFKGKDEIRSIKVQGYAIEPEFNEDIYSYEVTVYKNEVEITCDARGEIEGCNTTVDLTGKKEYIHMIKLSKFNSYKIYKITIKNQTR
jgi:hypothetical protein